MEIVSLQIGKSRFYDDGDRGFKSSFKKEPVDALIQVDSEGFVEDTQSDKRYHGGLDKAILGFGNSSAKLFEKEFNRTFLLGSFGENITFEDLNEESVCIGDIFKIAEVELEVSQPREPCWKVSHFLKEKYGTKFMFQNGLTGWYFRVLKEGTISKKSAVKRVQEGEKELSILVLNSLVNGKTKDRDLLDLAIGCEKLGSAFKKSLEKKRE